MAWYIHSYLDNRLYNSQFYNESPNCIKNGTVPIGSLEIYMDFTRVDVQHRARRYLEYDKHY